MRKRLMGCIAGGVVGFCLASLVNFDLGLSPALALTAWSMAGIAFGYVVTMLADVFIG
jgi:hypothetical protein